MWLVLPIVLLIPTQSTQPPVPKGWPPLPDFRQRVDYIQWMQDQLKPGLVDDASPAWAEIQQKDDDPPELKKSKAKLWGELTGERDETPGLFTGEEDTPYDYAWDPKDHPKWEQSYRLREAGDLRRKLLAIAEHKYNVPQLSCGEFRPSDTQPAILSAEDHLLPGCLSPSLVVVRNGIKFLLQDAWRAPGGKIDPERMVEAITTSIRIGVQQQREPNMIAWLVAIAVRDLAYETAIRALRPEVMPPEAVRKLGEFLRKHDMIQATESNGPVKELANVFDLLQFAYLPFGTSSPKPNTDRLRKIDRFFEGAFADFGGLIKPSHFLELQADMDDPRVAVREIADLHLQAQELSRRRLPQVAEREIKELVEAFSRDPKKHVFARELARLDILTFSRPCLLAARGEATRRATHILCKVSEVYASTGSWPTDLRLLKRIPPKCLIDPFSGKPFIYRVDAGTPVLYSVGMNGKDDGGKHDRSWGEGFDNEILPADYVFWPIQPNR